MKRLTAILIAALIVLSTGALAYGIEDRMLSQDPDLYPYEPNERPLYVVKCNEWVSVRSEPNTASDRIGILPLGSCIYFWGEYDDEFIYYDLIGNGGFVLREYLSYDPPAGY